MRKNLCFIGILLLLFALSKFLSMQDSQSNPLDTYLIDTMQQSLNTIKQFYENNPISVTLLFSISFFILTVLYFPFTGSLYVLFAGALFGFYKGVILFSFLVSISYTASFLISRYLFIKLIRKKLSNRVQNIINGFEKDGWVYLLSVRFSGVIPAVFINVAMGVTNISTWQYYTVAQLGTLPHVLAYVYAGSKIVELRSLNDLVSPYFFLFLVFLSLFPVLLKMFMELILVKKRKSTEKT